MDKECQQIRNEALKFSWYMRGGVTVNDLMDRYGFEDREQMYEIIKENIICVINVEAN